MDNYFYGPQSELFSFYRVPKVLFQYEQYKYLSAEAKILYGLLLDRMDLSARNGWVDARGRVYIIFTIEEVMEKMNCGNKKAVQMLSDLETKAKLIERQRQGLGKPNLIYVLNFVDVDNAAGGHFQKCQNNTSGSVQMTFQEVSERHGINTDNNHTEYNDTDPILSGCLSEGLSGSLSESLIGRGSECLSENLAAGPRYEMGYGSDEIRTRAKYERYFREALSIDLLLQDRAFAKESILGILDLLVDVCCSKRKMIRIAGDDKPLEVVKSQFMKLDADHVRYVLGCMKENTTDVRNIRQYLLTALYNAPATIDAYYQAKVNYDLCGGAAKNANAGYKDRSFALDDCI